MFVILEWSQAGGEPSLATASVYTDQDEALDAAAWLAARSARIARCTVHQIDDKPTEG